MWEEGRGNFTKLTLSILVANTESYLAIKVTTTMVTKRKNNSFKKAIHFAMMRILKVHPRTEVEHNSRACVRP